MTYLDHLSYSSISSYLMCARAWRFHYVDKVAVPTSPALVFGSAFHTTVEEHVKTFLATERVPVVERWGRAWSTTLEGKTVEWGTDSPEKLYNDGVRMLTHPETVALLDGLRPLDAPNAIERKVELHVPGVPIPVIGYIDMLEADGVPADFKTSSKSWSQDQAAGEMQPCFYLVALNQEGYTLNPGRRFRHYVFVKTKTPQVQVWETTRSWVELFWMFTLIREVWQAIDSGCFPPNPGTWKCSPRYCEYWGICRG